MLTVEHLEKRDMNNQIDVDELVPATEFLMRHKNLYPTFGKARAAMNRRKVTGLNKSVVQVGRLLFISPSRYYKWMDDNLEGQESDAA